MRARLLPLVLVHLVVSSCGTGVFVHAFEIAIEDPAGRLGPPPAAE
ncbi:MAG: hypothetical protein AB7H81_14415 [Vicinamibacterales bacterium]